MLEDLFWESTYSSFSQEDYNLIFLASKEANPLTEEEESFTATESKEGGPSLEFVFSSVTPAGRYNFPLKLLSKSLVKGFVAASESVYNSQKAPLL
jgi:hypothetical protein